MNDWSLILSGMAAFLSALSLLVNLFIYRATRTRKVRIFSELTEIDGEPVAVLKVTSIGQAQVVVENAGLSLVVWDDRPKLRVGGVLRFLRGFDLLSGDGCGIRYISDLAIVELSTPFPASLSEHQSVTVCISIDKLMDAIFSTNEFVGGRSLFAFMMFALRCEVVTPAKTFKVRAHREIRWYLWERYKNDSRLLEMNV